jgi:hypothetical protein
VRDCVGLPKRRQPNLRRYIGSFKIGVMMEKCCIPKTKLDQTATNPLFTIVMPMNKTETERDINGIINEGFGWAGGCFKTLGEKCAVTNALYSWYVERNLAAAKQWFYVAAKLIAISSTKPVGNETFWSPHPLMFPLLSDCPEMIAMYSTIETQKLLENRLNVKSLQFDIYLIQLALQGDYLKLTELIETYKAKKCRMAYKKSLTKFLEALISGDIMTMESTLLKFTKWGYNNPTTEDFLSIFGVILCKLTWLKGFEVQVDSPLIPMAFMPVAPLAHYEDIYEFMKPDWVAPLPPPKPSDMSWDDYCRIEHTKKMIEDKIIKPPFIPPTLG